MAVDPITQARVLTGLCEDYWTDEATQLNRFMPIAIATRALKPATT